ncbi:uncharacterized protein [Nicotiana tomentosiformis]|uniref:uncharacterized protein n=1 Tax=Nicotiana tomentosiformis TaxID=4098 RepID=UPI00388CD97E
MPAKKKYTKRASVTSQGATTNAAQEEDTPAQGVASGSVPNTSDIDVRGAIQFLTQIVATQAQRQGKSVVHETGSSRSKEFLNMKPPVFTWSRKDEDPQNFIDKVQKIFRVMHATDTKAAELTAYQLKDVANTWERQDRLKEEERLKREKDREFSKRAKSAGNFSCEGSQAGGNRQFFRKSKSGLAPSSGSAPVQRSKFNRKNQNFRAADSQSQASVDYKVHGFPVCNTCGKRHPGVCHSGTNGCFGCGQHGHFLGDYPSERQNNGGNVAQSTNSATPQNSQAQQGHGV